MLTYSYVFSENQVYNYSDMIAWRFIQKLAARIHNILDKPLVMVVMIVLIVASQSFCMRLASELIGLSNDYDVIVVGTDPEGIAAAVSSARNGMRTLLIDDRDRLGGLWTVGGLNFIDMNRGPDKQSVVRGIFGEFYDAINKHRADKKIESFDTREAEGIFQKMIEAEPNLDLKLKTRILEVVKLDDSLVGLVAERDGVKMSLSAKRIIDATQDADIAAKSGVPYYAGMEDINCPGQCQPMTLIFEMANVDWKTLHKQALLYRRKTGFGGATDGSAWGFLEVMKNYKHRHKNIKMRGLNVGKLNGNHVLINSMLIVDMDPLDKKARAAAMEVGKAELKHLAPYIIKNIPGFKGARLVGGMPELYVRESRHIIGQYRLNVNDIIENTDFPDKIALGSYPLDIQRTSKTNAGFVLGRPKVYSIPFRCLVPEKVKNLLVVGRCASYDSLAHASTRTVPVGMATGQAAGVAASVSIRDNVPFENIASNQVMELMQKTLREQGAMLDMPHVSYPYQNHWALHYIRFLRGLGLLTSGYNNDYRLDAPVSSARILGMVQKCENRCFIERQGYPNDLFKSKKLSKEQAARFVLYLAGEDYTVENPMQQLISLGLISESDADNIRLMPKFNNAAWFMMLHDYIEAQIAEGKRVRTIRPHLDK